MKLLYELEDSVVGIFVGVLLLVPLFFSFRYFDVVLPLMFGVFLLLNAIDVIYFAKGFHESPKLSIISFVINVIDVIVNLAFLSKILSFNIPFITEKLVPLITPNTTLIVAGYFIIINVLWIIWYHKK